ncbi:MAG: elongation factor 1-beta [Candidatus Altiarchaeota archaeon]
MADWNVVANLRIMPDDISVDLTKVAEKVKMLAGDKCAIHSMTIKPIAFGLKALEVNILLNDKKGGMEEIEEAIRKIEGVGEVETTGLNRL